MNEWQIEEDDVHVNDKEVLGATDQNVSTENVIEIC